MHSIAQEMRAKTLDAGTYLEMLGSHGISASIKDTHRFPDYVQVQVKVGDAPSADTVTLPPVQVGKTAIFRDIVAALAAQLKEYREQTGATQGAVYIQRVVREQ